MPPQGIDYDALAKEQGGVDYDAIAREVQQSAAAPSQPDPSKQLHVAFGRHVLGSLGLSLSDDQAEHVGHAAIGAIKGLGHSVETLGKLAHKLPGMTGMVDAVYGTPGLSDASFKAADEATTPTNTAQRLGYMGEQAAEFLIPGPAAEKTAATIAAKTAGLFRNAPRLVQSAAAVAPKAITEAATAGGVAAAQGSNPTPAAVVGGAGAVAGRLLEAAPAALETFAAKNVMQALGPTKERFKAMAQKITPEILKRGLRGNREGLAERAAQATEAAGQQIDDALQQFGSRQVGTQPIVDALEKAKDAYRVTTDLPLATGEGSGYFVGRTSATADDVWFKALADARKQGFRGSVGELRATFQDRVRQAKSLQNEMEPGASEYGPEALLATIRKAGGLKPFTKDYTPGAPVEKMRGDFASIVESFGSKSTWGQKGGGSIFRENGLGVDEMVERLNSDPRWANMITNEHDLFDVLDDVARQGPSAVGGEGIEHYLAGAGVVPGARWWEAAGPRTVEIEPRALRQIDSLQNIIKQLGPDARVDQLVAVRRAWDKVVAQAGGYAHRAPGGIGVPLKDASEADIKRGAATAIRGLLNDEVPELAAVNKEYAFWKSLDDVLTQTMQRTAPHGQGLGSQVKEATGAAIGATVKGGGIGSAFALGKLAKMANAVFTSPRWRLASAQMKDRLAQAIVDNDLTEVAAALSRISAGGAAQIPAPGGVQ